MAADVDLTLINLASGSFKIGPDGWHLSPTLGRLTSD